MNFELAYTVKQKEANIRACLPKEFKSGTSNAYFLFQYHSVAFSTKRLRADDIYLSERVIYCLGFRFLYMTDSNGCFDLK